MLKKVSWKVNPPRRQAAQRLPPVDALLQNCITLVVAEDNDILGVFMREEKIF